MTEIINENIKDNEDEEEEEEEEKGEKNENVQLGSREQAFTRLNENVYELGSKLDLISNSVREGSQDAYERIQKGMNQLGHKLESAAAIPDDDWEDFLEDIENNAGDVRSEMNLYLDGSKDIIS